MSVNEKLARSLHTELAWLAVNGQSITLKELGVRLSEIDTLHSQLYCSVGQAARLQDFLKN